MELMDCSLDKFYKFIYEELNEYIPEAIIGKITLATVKALNYLKVGFPANSNSAEKRKKAVFSRKKFQFALLK
jgi:hypothetical protein